MTTGKDTAELKRLFDTGAHFAQVKSRRHPSMKPYLVGTKGRQEIIDLVQTAKQLEAAKAAMEALAKEGKTVLFVGGKVEIAALESPIEFLDVFVAVEIRPLQKAGIERLYDRGSCGVLNHYNMI